MNNLKLSIYFGYHDSCVTFSTDEKILLHLEAERFFRKKHMKVNMDQMANLIQYGLDYLGMQIGDFKTLYLAKWNNQFSQNSISICGKRFEPILTGHHDNHIGTSYPSNFKISLIVCADGGSEDGCTKLYIKNGNNIKLLEDFSDELITGRFYGTITQMIIDSDFSKAHNFYPGKTMGLAALGYFSEEFHYLLNRYKNEINQLHLDNVDKLRETFKLSDDYSKPWLDQRRCDLAFTAQHLWQNVFVEKVKNFAHLSENICMVGGCALNVLLNTALVQSNLFRKVYVSPVSGDGGQSLGALLFHHPYLACDYPFLGTSYGEVEDIPNKLIDDLLQHKIIAWYQGRSEIGARALGHRSFLGLPDSKEMKVKLNEHIKGREAYRPIAPIVSLEDVGEFFDSEKKSPFMTYALKAKENTKRYAPAIVHYDNTSRVQTLDSASNPILHAVLKQIGELTGVPILMNTSFNIASSPIVNTPSDAMQDFIKSKADVLYINGERYVN
jgi:carbamoyltransferase